MSSSDSRFSRALLARKQLPAADSQNGDARVISVAGVADHVAVTAFHLEHDGGLFHLLEVVEGVAQFRGTLEVELLGREIHPLLHAPDNFFRTSREEKSTTSSIIERYSCCDWARMHGALHRLM